MDADLEDGELSSSDSEMGPAAATGAAAAARLPAAFSGQSFQPRAAYRRPESSGSDAASASSSEEDEDEAACVWRRKRQKVSNAPQPPPPPPPVGSLPRPEGVPGRRVNNIWGSVVEEQRQDAVAAELGFIGVEGEVSMSSRSVETYNYLLARKMMEKEKKEEEEQEEEVLDTQLDAYMRGQDQNQDRGGGGDGKRKRSVKERLGPRAEMDIQSSCDLTEDDPEEEVAAEIARRLREPKVDLIRRVVSVVGARKALELLGETATLEENGGVLTADGARRRTPGGVYLNLLKNTPSVDRAQLRSIFQEEQRREIHGRKAAQRRRRHVVARTMKNAIGTLDLQEHDDVSRETFASDTNEALEALEEAQEEHEEQQEEQQEVVGTEEAAVVYNAAHLEVF